MPRHDIQEPPRGGSWREACERPKPSLRRATASTWYLGAADDERLCRWAGSAAAPADPNTIPAKSLVRGTGSTFGPAGGGHTQWVSHAELSERHRAILQAIGDRGAGDAELGGHVRSREFDDLTKARLVVYWPLYEERPAGVVGGEPGSWCLTVAGREAAALPPLLRLAVNGRLHPRASANASGPRVV